jgi:hypothetical protein
MAVASYSVPGVYRQPAARASAPPRVRTDVAGFVGVAGPRHLYEAFSVDDWRSFQEEYLRDDRDNLVDPPAGSRLADTVQDFFANGGARCWIVNIGQEVDASLADAILSDMLGLPRDGAPTVDGDGNPIVYTGLELLLRQDEVAIVAMPELHATIEVETPRTGTLPPVAEQACFAPCLSFVSGGVPASQEPPALSSQGALFTPDQILAAEQYLISRCAREPWRVFLILAPPSGYSIRDALRWRTNLGTGGHAAFYWPWLLTQDVPGQPVQLRPPIGFVAGVFARRDLSRGPASPPANETLLGAVAPETVVSDDQNGTLYDAGVNVIRAFPGYGIQVWGARTLDWTDPSSIDEDFAFVNIRRGLSAIERTVARLGEAIVFEPNLPMLRAVLVQRIVSYLITVFQSGALAGSTQDTSFFVRCDDSNNTPDTIRNGQLVCDVGVALAAPAEFIVFRVGRNEGVVSLEEGD